MTMNPFREAMSKEGVDFSGSSEEAPDSAPSKATPGDSALSLRLELCVPSH